MNITATEPLTALDRCDRCGAQAYVRTDLNDSELLWCNHHFTKNELTLLAAGAVVVRDERDRLLARPEPETYKENPS